MLHGRRAGSRAARVAAAVALTAIIPSCAGTPRSVPVESAVLITIDTLRADAFGAGGHPLVRSPHLDRLFRRSVQFSRAFSPCATTLASHTSMLTGSWPTAHGVLCNLQRVPEDLHTLAEILREAGFTTAAFVSTIALDASFNLVQGFDVYDFQATRTPELGQAWRPAARTLRRALAWWTESTGPRFLWVHVFEPHFPYEPPSEFAELYDPGYTGGIDGEMERIYDMSADPEKFSPADHEHLRALYHAEISGLDRALGRFLADVEAAPATLVVATADHGESLGEHDLHFKHGPYVYPQDVKVPLAVLAPGEAPGVVSAMVRTIDIPATVLARLGIDADLPEESAELLKWRSGGEGLPVFGLASMPWHEFTDPADSKLQRALRTPHAAYVVTPSERRIELFRRETDPGELTPLAPEGPEAEALRTALDAWISGAASPAAELDDPAMRERFQGLSYAD